MREWRSQHADAVSGLDRSALLCIDDIDAVAGDRRWEEALLALAEASASRGTRMLFSAGAVPANIPFELADLRSRLSAATLYRLRELDDECRVRALRRYASGRGDRHSGRRRRLRARTPSTRHAESGRIARPARLSLDVAPAPAHGALCARVHRVGLSARRLRLDRSDPSLRLGVSGGFGIRLRVSHRDAAYNVPGRETLDTVLELTGSQIPMRRPAYGASRWASIASRSPSATQSRASSSSSGRVLSGPATCDAPYGVPPLRVLISSGSP